ncbi:FliM/FliN family flagellar motor switch protein [Polycladidibacter hongkongensis]|uniref:FliM/FliN family flagellar motor switch protein n=1 Tax=Polycladidibacter hongkongensis TaxID=1647556 RepID=UPI000832DBDE|nr:FliM/FliN family flagellar motor switch protein [Pseudovibrio hongkongensis]
MTDLGYQKHAEPLAFWNAALSYAGSAIALDEAHSFAFAQGDRPAADDFTFTLSGRAADGQQHELLLCVIDYPFAQSHSVDLDFAQLKLLDPALRDALLAGVRSKCLSMSAAHLSNLQVADQARPLHEVEANNPQEKLTWLSVQLARNGDAPIALALGGSIQALLALLRNYAPAAQPVWQELRQQLTETLSISAARLSFLAAEVSALAAGDLIVLDTQPLGQRVVLEARHSRHHLLRVEQGWGCEKIEDAGTMSEEQQEESAGGAAERIDIGSLPVTLSLEIGRVEVSLAQLESWQAGALIDLPIPELSDKTPVIVRAAGKKIASGNFVEIGDRLALRIAEICQ